VIDSRKKYRNNGLTFSLHKKCSNVHHELSFDIIVIVTSRIVHSSEFSAIKFYGNTYLICDGLAGVIVVIFQGKYVNICQAIILQNVNLT
jgi:hypothetical protein